MNETVKIADRRWYCWMKDRKEYFRLAELRHLLRYAEDSGPNLYWAVIPSSESTLLCTYGKEGNAGWAVMERIHALDGTYDYVRPDVRLTWSEINQVANDIADVDMATFVGVRDPNAIAMVRTYLDPYGSLDNAAGTFYDDVEFAFSVIYGQHWEVWAKDENVLRRISDGFADVEALPWKPPLFKAPKAY